ncbi:SRPBCC family protein [Companilactobacillus insicii]|uniref:SRPBCC family protein n=1 Tax=Companilactobacillus insicii TaxID=1732567 RepID=UPI000F79701D|nr:SRPBCC family protein [Companilactobacillus insicii]
MSMYSRKRKFKATSEQIWDKITNPKDYSWRSNVPKVTIKNDRQYSEINSQTNSTETYTLVTQTKNESRALDIDHIDGTGRRTFELYHEDENTTTLKITEEFDAKNKFFQFSINRFFKKQLSIYLDDLDRALA